MCCSGNNSICLLNRLSMTSRISFLIRPSPDRLLPIFSPLRNVFDPLRAWPVLAVATFPFPSLERVILNSVQPAADQRIAHLDLVVEEGEGQVGIEGFDPQRHTGQFNGQRVDVHAVDAPLDHMPPQQCLHPVGEQFAPLGIIGRERQQFVAIAAILGATIGQA